MWQMLVVRGFNMKRRNRSRDSLIQSLFEEGHASLSRLLPWAETKPTSYKASAFGGGPNIKPPALRGGSDYFGDRGIL
jgi:hypothetical protein